MSEPQSSKVTAQQRSTELKAGVQAVFFRCGLYLFTVKNAKPELVARAGDLPFPALHVCAGPGVALNAVEIVGSPKSSGSWLYNPGDTLVVKIGEQGATLILSSVRDEGTQALEVKVDRLDGGPVAAVPPPARPTAVKVTSQQVTSAPVTVAAVSLKAALYLKGQGEVQSIGADWLGRLGSKAWIESVAISPLDPLSPTDLEYKGLSANGFESPWLSNGATCGTRDAGVPLIGLAFRLKPAVAAIYDCEYTGSFVSGARIGPLKNGVPCRSKSASDPLEAIQLRIVNRAQSLQTSPVEESSKPAAVVGGPSFGKFREEDSSVPIAADAGVTPESASRPKESKKKQQAEKSGSATPNSNGKDAVAPSKQRSKVPAEPKTAVAKPAPQKSSGTSKKKTK